MRRRRIFLVLGGSVLTVLLVIVLWPREPEPRYKGKTLSQWLDRYPSRYDTSDPKDLEEAILHIGTNGLPVLLKWVAYEHPAWKSRVLQGIYKFSPRLGGLSIVYPLYGDQEFRRQEAAVYCFEKLGSRATAAIPELDHLIRTTKSPEVCRRATDALSGVGKEALPCLLAVLSNGPLTARETAATRIAMMCEEGINVNSAVPLLVQLAHNPDPQLAYAGTFALGRMGAEPELVLPWLADRLEHWSYLERRLSLETLANYGTRACFAVPIIVGLLNDPEDIVREAATNALLRISPESLTNAAPPSASDQK